MDLKELESGVDPRTHWYYQSKRIPLARFTRALLAERKPLHVVDVGAGSGFFSASLHEQFAAGLGRLLLVDPGYSSAEVAASVDQPVVKAQQLPGCIENSLVVLMDVLEHVEDDGQLLRDIRARCVGEHNHFFVTVPAFDCLWSGHDEYLGHHRRYTQSSLRRTLDRAGFVVTRAHYLYGSLFPVVWLVRQAANLRHKPAASNMRPRHPLVNNLLRSVTSLEAQVADINRCFGVTCCARGRIAAP